MGEVIALLILRYVLAISSSAPVYARVVIVIIAIPKLTGILPPHNPRTIRIKILIVLIKRYQCLQQLRKLDQNLVIGRLRLKNQKHKNPEHAK